MNKEFVYQVGNNKKVNNKRLGHRNCFKLLARVIS